MPEPFKTEEITEKLILVGVSRQDDEDTEDSLTELAELVETAGGLGGSGYCHSESGIRSSWNLCGKRKT